MIIRMQDIPWEFTKDQIAEVYPELKPEERAEAAYNLSEYVKLVAKIYDRLKEEGKWDEVKLRMEYDKRNQNKKINSNDDNPTPYGTSNEFIA